MLNLHTILWVIPGVIFTYAYNKFRPGGKIELSGWPYVFFLVILAAVTWIPAEVIVENSYNKGLTENNINVIFYTIFVISLFWVSQRPPFTKSILLFLFLSSPWLVFILNDLLHNKYLECTP